MPKIKAKVIEPFHDKEIFKTHKQGTELELSQERFDELEKAGHVQALEKKEIKSVKEKKQIKRPGSN